MSSLESQSIGKVHHHLWWQKDHKSVTAAGNRQQPNQTTSDSPLVQQSAKKSTSKDALTTFIFSQVTVPPLHRWFVLLSCINASGILAKLNTTLALELCMTSRPNGDITWLQHATGRAVRSFFLDALST